MRKYHDDVETVSVLLAFVRGIHQLLLEYLYKGPVMRSNYVFFGVSLNKLFGEQ